MDVNQPLSVVLENLGNYEAFGKNGIMVIRYVEKGKVLRFVHGNIPPQCEHNVKVLFNQGWPARWIADIYGISTATISRLLRGNQSNVNRLFDDQRFIGMSNGTPTQDPPELVLQTPSAQRL